MQVKTIIILAVILVVLLGLAIIASRKTQPPPPSKDAHELYFSDFIPQMAGRIILEKPAREDEKEKQEPEKVEVVKLEIGDEWVVANRYNYPAQESQINSVLDALENLKRGEVFSSKKETHRQFEVSADKALHLRVDGSVGGVMADFYIGKSAGGREFFARESGNDEVRRLNISPFQTSMQKWLNTSCFDDFQADNVTGIAVETPEFTYWLRKDEIEEPDPKCASKTVRRAVWKLLEPEEKEAKKGAGEALAGSLAKLSLQDIAGVEVKSEYGFDNAALVVAAAVTGRGNEDVVVTFGKLTEVRKEKLYYVQISGKKHIFLLPESTIKQFTRKLDDLREKPKEEKKETGREEETRREEAGREKETGRNRTGKKETG